MYAGSMVELADKKSLFTNPQHPYTRALLNAIPRPELRHETLNAIPGTVCNLFDPPPGCKFHPRCSKAQEICKTEAPGLESKSRQKSSRLLFSGCLMPLLEVRNLTKYFEVNEGFFSRLGNGRKILKAVDQISFSVPEGKTFGLVGESGCGKSTTARLITRLIPATMGEVYFGGMEILNLPKKDVRKLRKHIQMIFQDPYASLNPRMRVVDIVGRPLTIFFGTKGQKRVDQVVELLDLVGLRPEHLYRYPHEFSGGQRQRIGIARALAANPKLIIADEPVSSLERLGAGASAESAKAAAAGTQTELNFHIARSQRSRLSGRHRGCNVCRKNHGDCPRGGDFQDTAKPLYQGPLGLQPDGGIVHGEHRVATQRRSDSSAQSACGLPPRTALSHSRG